MRLQCALFIPDILFKGVQLLLATNVTLKWVVMTNKYVHSWKRSVQRNNTLLTNTHHTYRQLRFMVNVVIPLDSRIHCRTLAHRQNSTSCSVVHSLTCTRVSTSTMQCPSANCTNFCSLSPCFSNNSSISYIIHLLQIEHICEHKIDYHNKN